MLARRFLYAVAALILLVLAAGLAWQLQGDRLVRAALVPRVAFAALPDRTAPDYRLPAAWLARPGNRPDAALETPPGYRPTDRRDVAVFFVPPTTYVRADRWNAPIEDGPSRYYLTLVARGMASAFNGVGPVWAPRYRQATIGAFLAQDDPRSAQAIDFAYRDVLRAFDAFLAAQPADRPILLAAHSQGSLHLLRLLRERVAGTPLARRIVAAYAVGWPISIQADLPALGLPACRQPADTRCILSWQSYGEPADPRQVGAWMDGSAGFTGRARRGTRMLCTNPLTGTQGGAAPATANRGGLAPDGGLEKAALVPGLAPARCDDAGLLLIGPGPDRVYAGYILPGNNYHVFDYALFWANVRADAERRAAAFRRP